MDKSQAIQSWLDKYLNAYDQYTVRDDAKLPYITYNLSLGVFDQTTTLTISLWYKDDSWAAITRKASEIVNDICTIGVLLETDNGMIRIINGNPSMNRMDDPDDDTIRRIVINAFIKDYTANYNKR